MKLGEVQIKTYLSKSKISGIAYSINPYVGCPHQCVYCYAEYMKKFTAHTEPWGTFLDVRRCQAPLHPYQIYHTQVMLSSVTDAYNAYEKDFQITRKIMEQLVFCQAHVQVLTKSPLIVRDIDLFKKLPSFEGALSFSSADDSFRQLAEPGAGSVEEKISALKTLHENGLKTAVVIAPIFPQITNWKEIIRLTRPYADRYIFDALNLRPLYQKKVLGFIMRYYTDKLPLYLSIYEDKNPAYWQQTQQEINAFCRANGIPAQADFRHVFKPDANV